MSMLLKHQISGEQEADKEPSHMEELVKTLLSQSPNNDSIESDSCKEVPRRKRNLKPYNHISNEKREILLQRVLLGGESQVQVAKDLKINYSSAKSVLATYRKFGRVQKIPHRLRFPKGKDLKKDIQNCPKTANMPENSTKPLIGNKLQLQENTQKLHETFSLLSSKLLAMAHIEKERETIDAHEKMHMLIQIQNTDYYFWHQRLQLELQQQFQRRHEYQQQFALWSQQRASMQLINSSSNQIFSPFGTFR